MSLFSTEPPFTGAREPGTSRFNFLRLMQIILAGAIIGTPSVPAYADAYIEGVPTGWRLQEYVPGGLIAYYTGSSCVSGSLTFSASSTDDDRNRFWSLILTAKIAGKTVGVFYETTTGTCNITSFFAS